MKCCVLYKGNGLRVTISACSSCEMALNVCLYLSSNNTQDRKGIREKSGEVNSTKAYITNDGTCHLSLSVGYTNDYS